MTDEQELSPHESKSKRKFISKRAAKFAGWCSLVGFGVGLYLSIPAIGIGWEYFFILTTFSAFVTAYLVWWLLIEWRAKYSFPRSVLAGLLSGLLGHYTSWFIMTSIGVIYSLINEGAESFTEVVTEIASIPVYAASISLMSVMFLGIVTVPAGFVIGVLYGKHCDDQLEIV